MKELADGTLVSIETPTKIVNGFRYLLTPEEIAEQETEEIADKNRPPADPPELEVRLAALEKKAGITDQDKNDARDRLKGK